MLALPPSLTDLTAALGRLPGLGPRSAERLALYLAQAPMESVRHLAHLMTECRSKVTACRPCGALTESQPCAICRDPTRDPSLLCVVERPVDILSLEKAGSYNGKYHVLGGKLSPLDGIEPEDLRIAELKSQVEQESVREIILALGTDVESEATGNYLSHHLRRPGLRITRLAYGLPAGTGLEYADEITLSRALEGRRDLD